MDTLRVRVYNVRFGDAILISIPDAEGGAPRLRHILIDVGNALRTEGGADFVFKPVIEDIRTTIAGQPIDLYIMTHEHMDHVQGLYYGETKEHMVRLPVRNAWLPASSEPGYYDRPWPTTDEHGNPMPTPKQALALSLASYRAIQRYFDAKKNAGEPVPPRVQAMLLNNDPNKTQECVGYLRDLAAQQPPSYVHREYGHGDVSGTHPFEVAKLQVWAPEENTAVYYGGFRPMALGVAEGVEEAAQGESPAALETPLPLPGVDASAFYHLVEARRGGLVENLLAIDQSKNNSGIVFCLEWQGWKLLFTADAEIRSWKEMNKRGMLAPVHFLKISHHASHNGTPQDDLLEGILPAVPPDGKDRMAVASTYPKTYQGIPDGNTLNRLAARGVRWFNVFAELGDAEPADDEATAPGAPAVGHVEFAFPAGGSQVGVTRQVFQI